MGWLKSRVALAALLACSTGCGIKGAQDGDGAADVASLGDAVGQDITGSDGAADAGAQDAGAHRDAARDALDAFAPMGTTCADAIPLAADQTLVGQTTPDTGIASTQCRPSDGPQRFFTFVLPARARATITATPTGTAPWRLVMRAMTSCDAMECLTDQQSDTAGAPVTLVIDSPDDAPLTKVITVSGLGAGMGGAFDLHLAVAPMIPGTAGCPLHVASALSFPSDTVTGTLADTGGSTALSCVDPATSGGEAVYALHVDVEHAVEITTTCGSLACGVAVRRACDDATTDVACNATPAFTGAPFGELRTVLAPGDYFVVVDATTVAGGPTGDYTLTLRPFDPAPNFTCPSAMTVTDGTMVTDQHLALGGAPDLSCGGDHTQGGDTGTVGEVLYYRADVPPGNTLTAALNVTSSPFGMRLILRGDCAPGSCLPGGSPANSPMTYRNAGTSSQSVVFGVTVNQPLRGADAVFDLAVQIRPPAANASCDTATPVNNGTSLLGEDTALGGAPGMLCGVVTSSVLYYSATVAPMETLTVTATHPASAPGECTPRIRYLDGCASDAVCLHDGPWLGSPAAYVNTGNAPRGVVIAVECAARFGPEAVNLAFESAAFVLPPPGGDAVCAMATHLADGDALVEGPAVSELPETSCLAPPAGQARYYTASVPPGRSLHAYASSVSALAGINPQIRLADACDSSDCLAIADAQGFNAPEELVFANDGATARDVVFGVFDAGQFSLRVFIPPSAGSGQVAGLSVGINHACAVLADHTATCAGSNSSGQLGDGTEQPRRVPVAIGGGASFMQTSAGDGDFTCAIDAGAHVLCWGNNAAGQAGTGTPGGPVLAPTLVGGLGPAIDVTTGARFACAAMVDGTVQCWGANDMGQLGATSASNCPTVGACSATPLTIPGLTGVVDVEAGPDYACARINDGTVQCWGSNTGGQLGDATMHPHVAPAPVPGPSGVVQLALGDNHACALVTGGAVWCWGSDQYGQLGYTPAGGFDAVLRGAMPVPGLDAVTQLAAGSSHTCALRGDGTVWCWGNDAVGQLGDGKLVARSTPAAVVGVSGAVETEAGGGSNCARRADGTALCWGANFAGQLGDGTLLARPVAAASLF